MCFLCVLQTHSESRHPNSDLGTLIEVFLQDRADISVRPNVPVNKGVYPQRDDADIDASKGFIDLWVHFFVAIEDIHRNWYRRKC